MPEDIEEIIRAMRATLEQAKETKTELVNLAEVL